MMRDEVNLQRGSSEVARVGQRRAARVAPQQRAAAPRARVARPRHAQPAAHHQRAPHSAADTIHN